MADKDKPGDAEKPENAAPEAENGTADETRIEDAEILPSEDESESGPSDSDSETDQEITDSADTDDQDIDDPALEMEEAEDVLAESVDVLDEEEAEEPVVTPPPAPVTPAPARSGGGGFFGMLIGGALVAALGFGVAWFAGQQGGAGMSEETAQMLADQNRQISALSDKLDQMTGALADVQDSGALEARLDEMNGEISGQIGSVSSEIARVGETMSGLDARLTEIEKRPISQAGDASGAIAAYERELEAMKAEMEAQRTENETLAARVNDAAAQASAEIETASARAREIENRAALMQLSATVESGGGFAAALDHVTGAEIPPALAANAADGVATLARLRAEFPAAARAALEVSLKATADGDASSRITAFLRTQVGARSLEPREGDDPDAILSRAEAATQAGDLAGALAEIAALPQAGQDAMAGWTGAVQARLDTLAALAALQTELTQE